MMLVVFFTRGILAAAAPNPIVSPTASIDVNNPSSADPSIPPTSISFPSPAPNPYPSTIPTQPAQCNGQNPSDDCFNAMSGAGGYLWFDKDSECSDTQKAQLGTAVWDATTLAMYSSNFPDGGEANRGIGSGIFYMGPDYASQQSRIAGNLKRAWQFKTSSTSEKEYITVSCKDTENICNKKIGGKVVGGYAWTYAGWVYCYHYITLCESFFTLDSLSTKINDVEKELASGETRMATDMRYLASTGQFFLHEMMHTRIADGGAEPHITDEYVDPSGIGPKAYGPKLVNSLAKRSLDQGGGASRASTNADNYAMLANAIWWCDTTGYFPGVPNRASPTGTNSSDDNVEDLYPVSLYVDLGDGKNQSSPSDLTAMFEANLQAFDEGASTALSPTPTPKTTTTSTPPPPSTTTTPTPAAMPPPAADTCGDWYKFLFDHFEIYGKNFDAAKFGQDGTGLKKQIQGCGDLTKWSFTPLTNDPNGYQWYSKGNLPIGTKSCVGRAVVSAGGASADGCTGAG